MSHETLTFKLRIDPESPIDTLALIEEAKEALKK